MLNETWIYLDKNTNYVGTGIYVDDEVRNIDINIINNPNYWGVMIAGCDNDDNKVKNVVATAEHTCNMVRANLEIFEMDITIVVFSEKRGYTVSVMHNS